MPHFLHIRSNRFPILDGEEDEVVNPGTFGKSFALYLQGELIRIGYCCPFIVCEDWGWWVSVKLSEVTVGLACYREHDLNEQCGFACSLSPESNRAWSWKRFWFVDISDQMKKLASDLRSIFEGDPEVEFLSLADEFPDLHCVRNGEDYPR